MAYPFIYFIMLFTITRDQYQHYGENANIVRKYILDHYPVLCNTVETFNRYFGSERVDITADAFKEKSLLLKLLKMYEDNVEDISINEFLDRVFEGLISARVGIFQNLSIYVHWPSVTVTNERNQSVIVRDLYAMIPICPDGRLYERFTLSRATYPYDQYVSGYMHSHIAGINRDPSIFMRPCLGSGPLIRTQDTLNSYYGHDDLWDLFCVELDRYVHVESIAGKPYRYLDKIGTEQMPRITFEYYNRYQYLNMINCSEGLDILFKQFFKYVLIRRKMKFSFCNGMYLSSCNDTMFIMKLSKEFLKFFAMMKSAGKTGVVLETLLRHNILLDVKMNNGNLYSTTLTRSSMPNYLSFQGLHVLWFKGQEITTHVDEPSGQAENTYYVLNPAIAFSFKDQCLNYLNIYEHEKTRNIIQENQEDEVSGGGSSRCKNPFPDYPVGEKRVLLCL